MTDHRHYWPWPDSPGPACVEIGEHHCLRRTVHGGDPDVTEYATGLMAGGATTHLAGFIVGHDRADQALRCEGAVTVCAEHRADGHVWSMTGSLEGGDLTLAPSILCKTCGDHGFIREGRWVAA